MNWLAHVFLSESNIRFQLGNLIADMMKGRPWAGMSGLTRKGMEQHRMIDAFTDGHEIVRRSQRRLGERGRLRPVVVDVVYDHMLSRNWDLYCGLGLPDFLERFHRAAIQESRTYPIEVRGFIEGLISDKRLASYGSMKGVEIALGLIDQRLSDRVLKRESTLQHLPKVLETHEGLERDFLEFFPELIKRFGASGFGASE